MQKLDYLLLGNGISSLILGRLLIQKNFNVCLIKFNSNDKALNKVSNFYPVDINILRKYSIPFLEMSFKNAHNLSAYIERFASIEKFFLEPVILKDKSSSDGQFFNSLELGIVNSDLFNKYLLKLAKMKNLCIIEAEEIKIEKDTRGYSITIDENQFFECKEIIASDHLSAHLLAKIGIKIERKNPFHRITYVLDTIITDTIEYFFDFALKCQFISVIPGKSITHINLYLTAIDDSFDYKQIVELVLKEKYDLNNGTTDIKFVSNSTSFLETKIENKYHVPILISGTDFSIILAPILANPLALSIESAFSCYNSLIHSNLNLYHNWLLILGEIYNSSNTLFYYKFSKQDLYLLGKILSKKYISKLNFFQKFLVKIRIKSLKTQSYNDFPVIDLIPILNHSYLEKLGMKDEKMNF